MVERMFPALLKYWRGRRGLSQLDLACTADVSARHVSFLETGRAQPSEDMVLRLAAVLDVPLREQNALLDAAGFPPRFPEPALTAAPSAIDLAIERMMAQQEPYPLTVLNAAYDILRSNAAATRLFARFIAEPAALVAPLNVFAVLFDPRLARPFVVEWDRVARLLLARLHREALARPEDRRLGALLESLFAYPDVPAAWRRPDFALGSEATLSVRFRRDALDLAFLTTVTSFSAPQNVTLEELRIESYFPLDDATRATCERLAREAP